MPFPGILILSRFKKNDFNLYRSNIVTHKSHISHIYINTFLAFLSKQMIHFMFKHQFESAICPRSKTHSHIHITHTLMLLVRISFMT